MTEGIEASGTVALQAPLEEFKITIKQGVTYASFRVVAPIRPEQTYRMQHLLNCLVDITVSESDLSRSLREHLAPGQMGFGFGGFAAPTLQDMADQIKADETAPANVTDLAAARPEDTSAADALLQSVEEALRFDDDHTQAPDDEQEAV